MCATHQSVGFRPFVVGGRNAQFGPLRLAVQQEGPEPARDAVVRDEPQVILVELKRQWELFLKL